MVRLNSILSPPVVKRTRCVFALCGIAAVTMHRYVARLSDGFARMDEMNSF